MRNITKFWNSGAGGKVAIVGIASVVAVCGCCGMFGALGAVLPDVSSTPTLWDFPTLASTNVLLIEQGTAMGEPQTFTPTGAPTAMNTPTDTPTSTVTPTNTPTNTPTYTAAPTKKPEIVIVPTIAPVSTQVPPIAPTQPIQRYRTGAQCADGTTSTATGSGACSHHGGVSCWFYSDGTCTKP